MADNFIYFPHLNPVRFYDADRTNIDAYFHKHFDAYPFAERLYEWQDAIDYVQLWQTTDIINLQFESTFDPITVELVNSSDVAVISLPALVGLPNKFLTGTYSYEVEMSLAEVPTGCYRLKVTAGTGEGQKIFYSPVQHIYDGVYEFPTMLLEYCHGRYHDDVIFETGIEFQLRLPGYLGFLKPGSTKEAYRDQKQNPTILSSKTFRSFPAYFGDEFGLPDDMIDTLARIWSCDNVQIDGKAFAAVDAELEFTEADSRYAKRGVKLQVQEGLNRNSSVYAITTDTTKKLTYGIAVEAKVWGDTSNQGSANTVPIYTVE